MNMQQGFDERRDILCDDAPQGVVIDTQVSVNQPVSCRDDHSPGHLRIRSSHLFWNPRCRLSDQFQIAHCGVKGLSVSKK